MANTATETRTVVGMFDTLNEAQVAAGRVRAAGVTDGDISVVAGNESGRYSDAVSGSGEVGKGVAGGASAGAAVGGGLGLVAGLTALAIPGFGPVIAAGPIVAALTGAGIGAATGGAIGGLTKAGVSQDDVEYYSEGIRRGGALVTVRTSEQLSDEVADILDDAGAQDVDEMSREWRSAGWNPAASRSGTAGQVNTDRTIPVVEEELEVGKRDVIRGGVRVYGQVRQVPVEEEVTLRDETVRVARRAVNRPATEADFGAFREGTIELTETDEVPVVRKTARVVEEIVVGKDVGQRTETVRDTVRRTEVQVENLGPDATDDFRGDFRTRYPGRSDYETLEPAYRLGGTYAQDERYRTSDWNTLEPELKRDWSSRGQGSWEDAKDAIRHGWEKVRGRR